MGILCHNCTWLLNTDPVNLFPNVSYTVQKMKFSIKDFISKYDQIRRKLRIWSHLLKKSWLDNFTFCAVLELFLKKVMPTEPLSVTLGAAPIFSNKPSLCSCFHTLKEIIQIWNTAMGPQDQVFKICKKWMPVYKEWRSNLDKCISPFLKINYQRLKCPNLFTKWEVGGAGAGGPSVKIWSLAFSSSLLTLFMLTSSTVMNGLSIVFLINDGQCMTLKE